MHQGQSYILRIFFPSRPNLHRPPQMTRQIHGPALIRLLQQLAPMQRCLRDQRVVILLSETPGTMQRPCNHAHGLELCSAVTDGFLVDGESLREGFICHFLKPTLIGDLSAGDEQPQAEIGRPVACIECRDGRVHEFVEGGGLGRPIVVKVFS